MKGFIIIAVVVAAIVGLLFTLRSSRNIGTPSRDVLERAQQAVHRPLGEPELAGDVDDAEPPRAA